MKRLFQIFVIGALVALLTTFASAQVPQMINYQGKLTTPAGAPVNDTLQMVFTIYDSVGASLWTETQPAVVVEKGVFNVLLGGVHSIPYSVFDGSTRYLGVQVGGDPEITPRKPMVSVAYAYKSFEADTANYARAGGSGGDKDWIIDATDGDTTLFTGGAWGIARFGNILFGDADSTHVNLGVACTTGRDGSSFKYCTVGGGYSNTASDEYATIGGGYSNTASGDLATVGGGERNTASDQYATVGGGEGNDASNGWTTVGGGHYNTASGNDATVGGGDGNEASGNDATVGGGEDNTASGRAATVGGGRDNTASGDDATIGGGYGNTSAGSYSFTTGNSSAVPASYNNSAAFNGQTATASGQTRVGALSKASGSFTIDHPLDPDNKILNHYFIESPEMINIYRGVAHLDANGKAEIHLPDYFDALNRNTMVQLTGVGTSDVFVAEEVSGNRFVIGGKPGTKVYWMVTGDRKDPSAEITRIIMPVEQAKTEDLAGRSLDDAFLGSTMQQLERMGEAGKFSFRTTAGRQRYEDMKRKLEEKKPGR